MAKAKKAPKGTVKKLLPYLGAYKGRLALSLLFSGVGAGLTVAIPLLFGICIDLLLGAGNVNIAEVGKTLTVCAVLVLLSALGSYGAAAANHRVICGITKDLRERAYRQLHVLPLKALDAHPAGDTLSRVVNDVDRFADGLLLGFSQFFPGVITILGTLTLMFVYCWQVALAVVLLTPLSLVSAHMIAKHTHRYFLRQTEMRGELTAFANETVTALKTVKAFGREDAAGQTFAGVSASLKQAALKAIFLSSLTNPCTRFVNALVYAAVALTGALSVLGVIGGNLTVGLLTAMLGYANQYTKPFNEISSVFAEMQNALSCAARVISLIEAEPEPPEAEDARTITEPGGEIRLEHVDFSYTDAPFIRDLSLAVRPGQKAALVGTTGCGKTTLINLIMRFYEVDGGAVTLDGTDIRSITKKSLRSNIGMVLQDTWLKSATVRENLCTGNETATDEEMVSAAKRTHAHSFIKKLPRGYDTVLGEDGGGLSQGQKQLLCITRAMLSNPELLILDEATSSIDLATEIKVQKAFDELTKGRTCVIVAHRLSTVMHCDLIAVMDAGRIVETGTHAELLQKGGAYARLWASRNG